MSAPALPLHNPPHAPLEGQIAGHAGQIVALPNGLIAKAGPQKETDFYEALYASNRPDIVQFRAVLPRFAGAGHITHPVSGEETPAIHIENIVEPFVNASAADIKVGTRLYGDEANDEKRARMEEQARITTSLETGLRICGMKVYDPVHGTYLVHDKAFGRALTPATIHTGIRALFSVPTSGKLISASALRAVHVKLVTIRVALQQACVRLYGGSVLIVYQDEDSVNKTAMADVRLIDFAHSHVAAESEGPDEGVLFGVNNLIRMIEDLIAEAEREQ
ncbi:hypothetical protein DFJ77DRAFT_278157 [Powellomyces hirtus]|nr:hypothetical protein DFJ77DRAFT_278157 [Powellomyces hirtus]